MVTTRRKHNLFILLSILLMSCTGHGKKDNLSIYRFFASNLNASNVMMQRNNSDHLKSLFNKSNDPQTKERASVWFSKASLAKKMTTEIFTYIDSLKQVLKTEAGENLVNGSLIFRESDYKAVTFVFISSRNAEFLQEKILKFEKAILEIDPTINAQFSESVNETIKLTDPSENSIKTFAELFFENTPTVAAIATLARFQNSIRLFENQIITFCDYQVPMPDCGTIRI